MGDSVRAALPLQFSPILSPPGKSAVDSSARRGTRAAGRGGTGWRVREGVASCWFETRSQLAVAPAFPVRLGRGNGVDERGGGGGCSLVEAAESRPGELKLRIRYSSLGGVNGAFGRIRNTRLCRAE